MGIPLILAINDSYDLSDINIFCIVFTLINPHGDGGTGTTTAHTTNTTNNTTTTTTTNTTNNNNCCKILACD